MSVDHKAARYAAGMGLLDPSKMGLVSRAYIERDDEVQALRARVAGLEGKAILTADRVPVQVGDTVFDPSGRQVRVCVNGINPPMFYVPVSKNVNGDWRDLLVSECYSTHAAAAEAAKGGVGP